VYTENGVRVALGEGLWKSVSGLGDWRISLVDPETGEAGFFGALDEHGLFSLLAVRVREREGLITEIETIVARPERSGQWGELAAATHTMFVPPLLADLDPAGFAAGPAPALRRPPGSRTPRGELVGAVDRYFDGFVAGTAADVPLAEGCQRRENGVRATGNADGPVVDPQHPEFGLFALSCAEQLDAGYVARMSSVRRRPLVVDEEQGLVLDLALLDHAADRPSVPVAGVGSIGRATSFAAPNTDLVPQLFKIDGGWITHIEGLVRRVPYGQTGPWDPPLGE
jgi:hypothetical protein